MKSLAELARERVFHLSTRRKLVISALVAALFTAILVGWVRAPSTYTVTWVDRAHYNEAMESRRHHFPPTFDAAAERDALIEAGHVEFPSHVALVLFDAVSDARFTRADSRHAHPLVQRGVRVEGGVQVMEPTNTLPQVATMLTGADPFFHTYADNAQRADGVSWFETTVDQLHRLRPGSRAMAVGWSGVNVAARRAWDKFVDEDKFRRIECSDFDCFVRSTVERDYWKGALATDWVRSNTPPELLLLHLTAYDLVAGHRDTPNDASGVHVLKQETDIVHGLLDQWETVAPAYLEDAVVWMLADHGLSPVGSHGGNEREVLRPVFLGMGPALRTGLKLAREDTFMRDLAPTNAMLLGLPLPMHSQGMPLFDATALMESDIADVRRYVAAYAFATLSRDLALLDLVDGHGSVYSAMAERVHLAELAQFFAHRDYADIVERAKLLHNEIIVSVHRQLSMHHVGVSLLIFAVFYVLPAIGVVLLLRRRDDVPSRPRSDSGVDDRGHIPATAIKKFSRTMSPVKASPRASAGAAMQMASWDSMEAVPSPPRSPVAPSPVGDVEAGEGSVHTGDGGDSEGSECGDGLRAGTPTDFSVVAAAPLLIAVPVLVQITIFRMRHGEWPGASAMASKHTVVHTVGNLLLGILLHHATCVVASLWTRAWRNRAGGDDTTQELATRRATRRVQLALLGFCALTIVVSSLALPHKRLASPKYWVYIGVLALGAMASLLVMLSTVVTARSSTYRTLLVHTNINHAAHVRDRMWLGALWVCVVAWLFCMPVNLGIGFSITSSWSVLHTVEMINAVRWSLGTALATLLLVGIATLGARVLERFAPATPATP